MRKILVAAGAVLQLLLPDGVVWSQATQDTGSSELVRQCRLAQSDAKTMTNIKDLSDASQCIRYIEGFVAGASLVQNTKPFCVPNTTRIIDEVNSYVTWMDKNKDCLLYTSDAADE